MTKLDDLLFKLTSIEEKQQTSGEFVQDLPEETRTAETGFFELEDKYFFHNHDVFISKHNRFANYPQHSHQFLEMNYMYSGSCTQIIDGKNITLKKGDILLMDVGSQHSIKALGTNDILLNILFQNQSVNLSWLEKMKGSSSIAFQVLSQLTESNEQNNRHAIFHTTSKSDIQQMVLKILNEYFFPREFSNALISNLLPILLIDLIREYKMEMLPIPSLENNETMKKILKTVEVKYATTSLTKIAAEYSYNKNYLSNLIKQKTGLTFTQLLNRQKLMKAHQLILSTSFSISKIIDMVGFSNHTYFYQQYKDQYYELPNATRLSNPTFIPN